MLLSSSIMLSAQAPNIVQYNMYIFAPGVPPTNPANAIQFNQFQATDVICNQAAPTVPNNVINPTTFFFDDVAQFGRVCIGKLVSQTILALPNQAGYVAAFTQIDNFNQSSGLSGPSNPFARLGAPSTLTNVRIM